MRQSALKAHSNGLAEPAKNEAWSSRTRLKCLIAQPLSDLRTLTLCSQRNGKLTEPKHPHSGYGLGEALRDAGFEVYFSNQLAEPYFLRNLGGCRSRLAPELVSVLSAYRYDVIVAYSTVGAATSTLLANLPGRPAATVLILLSGANPYGSKWRAALRSRSLRSGCTSADTVVCGLFSLVQTVANRNPGVEHIFYAPTTVDLDFYDPMLSDAEDAVSDLNREGFILAVGDSSRDDDLLYAATSDLRLPVVRVSRDSRVVAQLSARALQNKSRGDRLLAQISFEQLRWLYSNCSVFVLTSRLDGWQAAGSTSLTEAMACGALCVCTGGGVLEAEWQHLAADAGIACPVRFYRTGSPDLLCTKLEAAVATSPDARRAVRHGARAMASRAFPLSRSYQAIVRAATVAAETRLAR